MRARHVLPLVLTVLFAAVAAGQADRGFGRPVLLRIEGHVGSRRPEDRGLATLTLRRGESVTEFQVNEIWVLSGDAVGLDILAEVEPYDPSMQIAGPGRVLDHLQHAKPEEPLELIGYFRRGVRILMLSAVEPVKPRSGRH
jgi:hypothetical protein